MFGSIFGSRNSHATTRHRSRPSSHVSRTTHRSRATEGDDGDEVKKAVGSKPDVEELRKRRQSHYSLSAAQRRQLSASVTNTKARSSKSLSTARSSTSRNGVRRRRAETGSRSIKRKTTASSEGNSRAEDFVYGTRPDPSPSGEAVADTVRRGDEGKKRAEDGKRSEKRRSTRHSKRQSLPTVMESEVTPDDSISQVAERRGEESHARKGHTRPSMKRSSTTTSKLPSIIETQQDTSEPTLSSKRSSRRESRPGPPSAPARRHSTTDVPSSTKLVECLTCGSDDIPLKKSAGLSCKHRMCHDCLKRIFEMSVKDPVHMPPKCCTDEHIPLRHVDKLFDTKFKILWNRKYQEYHTKNRIYCPTPRCGEWIRPKHIHRAADGRKYAACPRCQTKVCTLCNNKLHKSSDCPKDPEIARLVAQAKEKGWQRCFSCHAMVELQSGCNHISCRCRAEFCYLCGAPWKTCNCPWFNYAQVPNPDRLNEMRVPEPLRVMFRRVFDAAGPPPPPPLAPPPAQAPPPPEVTYQQEMDNRQAQERADAELARRLQLASLWEDEPPRRRDETWGVGNAAGHFLNENFVQNAANVVMGAFGDAEFGRRGERSAGRRRRGRREDEGDNVRHEEAQAGLARRWLGDESVLGVGPARRR